jgi:DNA-binding LacI/PurR family transcriptional regulator
MPPTISDVAEKANVSRTTVSRVLSQTPGFKYSEDTREKVLSAAKSLGYTPNPAAQLMRAKETKMVGIITQAVNPPFTYSLIEKTVMAIRNLGYNPVLIDLNETYSLYESSPLHRFDYLRGVICFHTAQARSIKKFCEQHNIDIDIVSLGGSTLPEKNLRVVASDHKNALKKAVNHLLDTGHRKLLYLEYNLDKLPYIDNKLEGFKEALQEKGIKPLTLNSYSEPSERSFVYKCAFDCAERVMRENPDAVICQNDESALGLIAGLTNKGLKVPEDISVMGYDDLPFAAYANPALTTMKQQTSEIALEAARLLVTCMEASELQKEYLPVKVLLDVGLIIRNSTRSSSSGKERTK